MTRIEEIKKQVKKMTNDPYPLTMLEHGTIKSAIAMYALLDHMNRTNANSYYKYERVVESIENGQPDITPLEKVPQHARDILLAHVAGPINDLHNPDIDSLRREAKAYAKIFPQLPDLIPKEIAIKAHKSAKEPKKRARQLFRLL